MSFFYQARALLCQSDHHSITTYPVSGIFCFRFQLVIDIQRLLNIQISSLSCPPSTKMPTYKEDRIKTMKQFGLTVALMLSTHAVSKIETP
jgi:hypothetical protein